MRVQMWISGWPGLPSERHKRPTHPATQSSQPQHDPLMHGSQTMFGSAQTPFSHDGTQVRLK